MQMKTCDVSGYAWLSPEQWGFQSRGICRVWGLPFCLLLVRGWIHGAFFICASLTGAASLVCQRNELKP